MEALRQAVAGLIFFVIFFTTKFIKDFHKGTQSFIQQQIILVSLCV